MEGRQEGKGLREKRETRGTYRKSKVITGGRDKGGTGDQKKKSKVSNYLLTLI